MRATQPATPAVTEGVLAREVWGLLMRVLIGYSRIRYREVTETIGLSIPQSYALMELNPDDRPASMRSLAACLHSDPSNITGLVDRLEAKGLVERRIDPSDRRVRALVLTDKGRRARAELGRIIAEPPPALSAMIRQQLLVMRDALGGLVSVE